MANANNLGLTPEQLARLTVVDHPLVQHKLSILRDEQTGTKQFRDLVRELALFEGYEATRDFELEPVQVKTPLEECTCQHLAGKKVAIVPILRAGLGMVDGVLEMLPTAKVGHIGLYRDPETLDPVEYYCKMPQDIAERDILIVDPMLATGGSADMAITKMKELGCKNIKLMILVAAPEGVQFIYERHPDVEIYCAALDDHLNENGYIVPGLGDAGDRIFGTK